MESEEELWERLKDEADFNGLIHQLVYARTIRLTPAPYFSEVGALVNGLADGDVDLLIDKTYRQNIAVVTRCLLQSRLVSRILAVRCADD